MKIAVVGLGRFGNSHLSTIDSLDCCELSAVCDINEEIASKYAQTYHVPYFTDYKTMAQQCDADAVVINLPHFLHCEASVYFLEHGFHVFVEKPMANTVEECQMMNEAQRRTGKILAATPMKKFGEVSDLIGALLWLADDGASGFVTGTVIPVDGGFSAYSGV